MVIKQAARYRLHQALNSVYTSQLRFPIKFTQAKNFSNHGRQERPQNSCSNINISKGKKALVQCLFNKTITSRFSNSASPVIFCINSSQEKKSVSRAYFCSLPSHHQVAKCVVPVSVLSQKKGTLVISSTTPISANSGQVAAANLSTSSGKESELPPQSGSGKGNNVQQDSKMIEAVVCTTDDIQDGQMKEVEVGGHKALLVKENGQFYATGNKCTHYGAPLSKGSYCNGVVRCPWHGACFNVKTGDIEDFPGLDSIQSFQVEVRDKDIVVKADEAALQNFRRVRPMVKQVSNDKNSVVIVGGGPASVVCAETLRQEGFKGKITLVSMENCLPYDRIKLSKNLNIKAEDIFLRKAEFYSENGISLMLGKEVTKIDSAAKQISLASGETLPYSSLVLATGGIPRRFDIPGINLPNIFVLRCVSDANAIADKIKDKNVVIVGTSFIGLEVATYMVGKAASVNVVGNIKIPLSHVFGPMVGGWFKKIHEDKGVKFHNETSVSQFDEANGKLASVTLTNGTKIPADVCVLGLGVTPATKFLKDSGISLTDRGFVPVDKYMRTNVKDVYAAGDITQYPLSCMGDTPVNIQHWQMAHQHGRIAGLDIAGKGQTICSVPYFWTVQYGKSIRYAGYSVGSDDVVLHGDLSDNKFVAYYTQGNTVVAVASLGWDPIVSQFAQYLAAGKSLTKEEVKHDPNSWTAGLK